MRNPSNKSSHKNNKSKTKKTFSKTIGYMAIFGGIICIAGFVSILLLRQSDTIANTNQSVLRATTQLPPAPICSINSIGNRNGEFIVNKKDVKAKGTYSGSFDCYSMLPLTDNTVNKSDFGQADVLNKIKITSVDSPNCHQHSNYKMGGGYYNKYRCTYNFYFNVLRTGKSRLFLQANAVKDEYGQFNARAYSDYFNIKYSKY